MNIFETAKEFVNLDNRKDRNFAPTTSESLIKKLSVQLPESLIANKTILDLGSCLGAAGHYALTFGAKHYVGVEIQPEYNELSKNLLSRYWSSNKFEIVNKDINDFLDSAIAQNIKYDYVLAAGVIYGFLNIIDLIKKISKVSKEYIVIDTLTVPYYNEDENTGLITISKKGEMVSSSDLNNPHMGIGIRIDSKALDLLMSINSFKKDCDIKPEKYLEKNDPYHDIQYFNIGNKEYQGPARFISRYIRVTERQKTLEENIISSKKFDKQWVFDNTVAEKFQHEAETNIPSYHLVIDKCLQFANKHLQKTDKIIDVGSAIGYTMSKFINAGFTDVMGVDNSPAMNDKNIYSVVCSDKLPNFKYKLVLMNWTLHFIVDKESYLRDIYNSLDNGYLILTEKCLQSKIVKDLYYDFKRSNGVSEDYIKQKENSLIGVMHLMNVDWYLKTLQELGFSVDIIHAEYGFVTFICKK